MLKLTDMAKLRIITKGLIAGTIVGEAGAQLEFRRRDDTDSHGGVRDLRLRGRRGDRLCRRLLVLARQLKDTYRQR